MWSARVSMAHVGKFNCQRELELQEMRAAEARNEAETRSHRS
jgi:hypothetical protein